MINLGLKKDTITSHMELYPNLSLGRVIAEHKHIYKLITDNGEISASVSGKFSFSAKDASDFPTVGDWVAFSSDSSHSTTTIHAIIPRYSCLSRKVAGSKTTEQILASNIDIVLICMSLNSDFNLRKLERYLSVVWESNAQPVIVLTKSDLCNDIDSKELLIASVSNNVPYFILSSTENIGVDKLISFIGSNKTVALIGSSGVGKSTLINAILKDDHMLTGDIRIKDDKGKHTTTHRELIPIPNGGAIIDTPGMRELQLFNVDLNSSFEDIETLSLNCRFSNCTHSNEPGCAINAAIDEGILSPERYKNYKKLQREIKIIEKKKNFQQKKSHRKKYKSKKPNSRKFVFYPEY